MRDIYSSKDRAEKELAIQCMEESIANWIERYKFHVRTTSDDGGALLEVLIEVVDPSEPLYAQEKNLPQFQNIWMGWRLIITKIPIGYIKVFYEI